MGCNGIPGGQPYNREERSKRTETVRDPDPQKTNGQGEDNAYPERRPSKPAALKKRLKHVGVYLHSRHFTARGEMPGVEIHANMLETLFQGSWLRRSPQACWRVSPLPAFYRSWRTAKCREWRYTPT